jgi:hypothetical protein
MMKGFFSVEGLLGLVITLVMYLSLYPFIDALITTALPTMDAATGGLLRLIPFFWLFILMLAILAYLPGSGGGGGSGYRR